MKGISQNLTLLNLKGRLSPQFQLRKVTLGSRAVLPNSVKKSDLPPFWNSRKLGTKDNACLWHFSFGKSSVKPPPHTHKLQITGNSTTLHILWSHHTSLEQEPRKRATAPTQSSQPWFEPLPRPSSSNAVCPSPSTPSQPQMLLFSINASSLWQMAQGSSELTCLAGSPVSWGPTLLSITGRIRIAPIPPASDRREQGWGRDKNNSSGQSWV